jgi:hypothetical protein
MTVKHIGLPWVRRIKELRKLKVDDTDIIDELLKYGRSEERRITKEFREQEVRSKAELRRIKAEAAQQTLDDDTI